MTSLLKGINQKHYEKQNVEHFFVKKQNENLSITL